jgi:large subunit ribosomal protein L9
VPKTEVILTSNIVGLGAESDQVKVAAGYARNYLFPQGLAIPLTAANKRRLESLRQKRAEREAHDLNTMTELAKSMSKVVLVIRVKTGDDGKMFGSVTAGTLADELKHQLEVTLDKKKIHLEQPIRSVGDHEVELRLYHGVNATLKVKIESTTPVPKAEEPAPAPTQPQGQRRDAQAPGRRDTRRPDQRRPDSRPAPAEAATGERKTAPSPGGERKSGPPRKPKSQQPS